MLFWISIWIKDLFVCLFIYLFYFILFYFLFFIFFFLGGGYCPFEKLCKTDIILNINIDLGSVLLVDPDQWVNSWENINSYTVWQLISIPICSDRNQHFLQFMHVSSQS